MKRSFGISVTFWIFLFFLSYLLYGKFSVMGVSNAKVQTYVISHFWKFALLYNFKILLFYLFVALIVALFCRILGLKNLFAILGFNIFFWAFYWLRGVKIYPQMFVEQLYNKGGLLKEIQILITDYIPLWSIYLLFGLAFLIIGVRRKKILQVALISFLVGLSILKIHVSPLKNPDKTKFPNILILGSDSLRPSNISYNGYRRKTTPNIDKLFSEGANFTLMLTPLARTFSSWTTFLTSLDPPWYGIRNMFPRFEDREKKWITLTDVLKKHGYYTGVISDFAGDLFPRVDYGFDEVKAPYFSAKELIKQRSLEIHHFILGLILLPSGRKIFPILWEFATNPDPYFITEKSKKFIKKTNLSKKPFFLISFYSCTHFPYAVPYPYYRLYTKKSYTGPHKYLKGNLLKEYNEKIPEKDKEQILALYDGGVRMFDDTVGEMVQFLRKSRLLDNTIIIIMSDHGENLYEYGYGMGHGDHLRGKFGNAMTFGIWWAKKNFGGRIIREVTREKDIAPTILGLLRLKIPSQFQGKNLVPAVEGKEKLDLTAYMESGLWYSPSMPGIKPHIRIFYPDVTSLMEVDNKTSEILLKKEYSFVVINAKQRALRTNRWKYIYIPGNEKVREELYKSFVQIPAKNKAKFFPDLVKKFREKMLKYLGQKAFISPSGYIIEKENK